MKRSFSVYSVLLIAAAAVAFGAVVIYRAHDQASVCANSVSCTGDLSGDYQPDKESVFMGERVTPEEPLALVRGDTEVLGEVSDEKHIVVDLSSQTLTAYEGETEVMTFPVATGRWWPTPTGEFRIWVKLRYAHMEGGNPADGTYYNLYNVPYTMYFYGDNIPKSRGFGLHGAYWHNNFGHPMSHGCVNLRPEDAGLVYEWVGPAADGNMTHATRANPGTRITITGITAEE